MNETGEESGNRRLSKGQHGGKQMAKSERNENTNPRSVPTEGRNRIVHLTTVHHPFDPRIFYKQLASLSKAGFDTHLVAPHHRVENKEGVTIHPLPEPENRWQRLALQRKVWRKAHVLGADLYQIHDPELIPLAFLIKTRTDAQVVYDMHEDYRAKGSVLGRGLRALERWCFRWGDHVLFAEESYRPIFDGYDVDRTYIANYFKPIGSDNDDECRREPRSSAGPVRLLYTGTVAEKRGMRTMIDLAEAIGDRERTEKVRIVGICRHADQRAAAEARIQSEGLHRVVERVGWDTYVPPTAMPSHYRWADVGLALCDPHPNLMGSLLTKFYEYLHYGLPIICSDFPLWASFIEENNCGVVVPPGDADAVLDVLTRWQQRPDLYREYVRNARAAASGYRWEKMEKRLIGVYRELLSSTEG
jgi:glycosyltransferase involved in cell wall biosynthesis